MAAVQEWLAKYDGDAATRGQHMATELARTVRVECQHCYNFTPISELYWCYDLQEEIELMKCARCCNQNYYADNRRVSEPAHKQLGNEGWIEACPGNLVDVLLQIAPQQITHKLLPCRECKEWTLLKDLRIGVNWFQEYQLLCHQCWCIVPDPEEEPDYMVPEWPCNHDCIETIKQIELNAQQVERENEQMRDYFGTQ